MVEPPVAMKNKSLHATTHNIFNQKGRVSRKQVIWNYFFAWSPRCSCCGKETAEKERKAWQHISYKQYIGPSSPVSLTSVVLMLQKACHPRSEARSQQQKDRGKKIYIAREAGRCDKEKGASMTWAKINREPLAWTAFFSSDPISQVSRETIPCTTSAN